MKLKMFKAITCLFLGFTVVVTAANPEEKTKVRQTIKVALLLDTSNSMDGLINQAKTQLWEIINELSYAKYGIQQPDLEIALYEYGNDRLESSDGYIRQVLPFSNDLDDISEKLFSLVTNGGKEYCGQVINSSIKELDWGIDTNDLKLIFIAGNEPFTQGKINYKEVISNAKEKDIIVNTIYCGDYQTGISGKWKDGAELGGGDYMTINQNKEIVHIVTPFDDAIIILNKQLNNTYIYYGNRGKQKFSNQSKQDSNALEINQSVVVKRAVSKSNRLYENAGWDLVDKAKKSTIDYSEIDRKKLPVELQKKSDEELKKYVEEQDKIRSKIKVKINELNRKRKIFIAKKQNESMEKGALDNVIIQAIKKQAKAKNYSW